ncbi:MAG: sporulation protein YqfD [Clostridia bacterium]
MRFDLSGYNIDYLLKTLYLKKITLINLVRTAVDQVSFEVLDKDIKKVKRHIANYKVKSTPSIVRRLPKIILANIGIMIGVIVSMVIGAIATKFTWQIEIFGLENLSKKEILEVLSDNDISVGKINTQTSEHIEEILMNNYDRIAQVSVIRHGTAIIINLSEKLVYREDIYEPIRAKYDGIISSIRIVTGTTNVKIGDYVHAGDVLVLPFNINSHGEKVSVRPIAEIDAEIYIVGSARVDREETALVRTGRISRVYKYEIFNFSIFSGKNKNSFALFDLVSYNENVSRLIPLSRDVYVYHELTTSTISHDFDQERDQLLVKSRENAYLDLPIGEILEETSEIKVVNDSMFAYTTIRLLGNINDIN